MSTALKGSTSLNMVLTINGLISTATFLVKEDFYMYTGGVYKYTLGPVSAATEPPRSAYHSVRILGWGVDRTDPNIQRPYWVRSYTSWSFQMHTDLAFYSHGYSQSNPT